MIVAKRYSEIIGLFIGLIFIVVFAPYSGFYDLGNYLNAANGDFSHYYYLYWGLFLFEPIKNLPLAVTYVLISVGNVIGVYLAAKIFNGNVFLALVSHQMLWGLRQGNLFGIVIGGIALFYWGYRKNNLWALIIGVFLGSIKPQLGAIPLFFIFLQLNHTRQWQIMSWITVLWGISIWQYGFWPIELIKNIQQTPPMDDGSISLWRYFGIWSMGLWGLALLKLEFLTKLKLLVALNSLTLPYFQATDLVLLYSMSSISSVIGIIGYLYPIYGWLVFRWLTIIPIFEIIILIYRGVNYANKNWRGKYIIQRS